MSANLATDDRTDEIAMWCVGDRDAAWHKLGQRTPDAQNWMEVMQLAHLDWTVEKRELYSTPSLQGVSAIKIPDKMAIFRTDNQAYLGVVGDGYQIMQNKTAFDFIDYLLQARDGAHYESAGVLGKGERIWVMAKLPETIRIAGTEDLTRVYLLIATAHDGSMAYTAKLVAERVVCENTLAIALGEASTAVRIKHTKSAQARLALGLKFMASVGNSVQSLNEKLNILASRKLTRESATNVFDRLFPQTKDEKGEVKESKRRDNVLSTILSLYESNDKNAIPEVRGTAYNLLNAITEYTDHFRPARITEARKGYSDDQARAENALFGSGEKLKAEALDALLDLTGGIEGDKVLAGAL
jgi:phage/plasmid-like protein (TIGR03299 family)